LSLAYALRGNFLLPHLLTKTQQHFAKRQGLQFAASLSYSTLLSVVPISILLFFISLQTELFAHAFEQVREQLLAQLLPTSREQVEAYLLQTTHHMKSFSYLSMAFIFFSAVWLSLSIERALNHIWHVKTPRKIMLRIPAHITLWLLAPILITASISLSTWMASLPYLHDMPKQIPLFSKLLPYLTSSTALFLLYFFVPNTSVKLKYAGIASFSAGLIFEVSKWLFTIYITQYAMYNKLYGALATLPIFMLWILISWIIVLWGASLSFVLQHKQ
jgi:membrane protein